VWQPEKRIQAQKGNKKIVVLLMCYSLMHLCTLTDLDHLGHDTSNPAGCQCHIICPPVVCCELCNPQHFTNFACSDSAFRPKQLKNCAHIADYKADKYDISLCDALNEFCEQETIKKFGLSWLKNSRPGLIMPNEVLKQIINCVDEQKITTKEHLQLETCWSHVDTLLDFNTYIYYYLVDISHTDEHSLPRLSFTTLPI
jgi:hypothetical protein